MTGALDEKANFTQLNRRFRPVLMAYFLRRLRNHSEAAKPVCWNRGNGPIGDEKSGYQIGTGESFAGSESR